MLADMDPESVAAEMLDECARAGQAARRVADDADAAAIRSELRRLARAVRVRIRTARMDGTVVAARTDAQLWNDDAATMRAKLTPR